MGNTGTGFLGGLAGTAVAPVMTLVLNLVFGAVMGFDYGNPVKVAPRPA